MHTVHQYHIRVRGLVGPTILQAFPALEPSPQGRDTVLAGPVADQAALFGLLDSIEALGLELLEVRRVPAA